MKTYTGGEGIKVRIPGTDLEAEVKSEQECAAESVLRIATPKDMYDERMKEGGYGVPGTKGGYFCNTCGKEIVLAPSGQRLEAMGGKFTCARCVVILMQDEVKGGN